MNNNKYLTVSAITQYLKSKFDSDEHLRTVFLKGEISNYKSHSSGHLYFSIKDETSKINAIMFSSSARNLTFNPSDGAKVLVVGRISIYEATGNYQIYVDEMIEDGVGNLYLAFEKLKEQLSKEGLFDDKYKKPIPKIPKRVGVITAPTGAAIKDILSTIKRRFPVCEVILFPSLVQGDGAKDDLVKNIKLADNYDLDLLIVGRGGGSIEDLWPFNEEIVARAIFNSKIPIISAVGHEVDYTIADFVSDLRAPTPTGAAEMAVPNIVDLIQYLDNLKIRFNEYMYRKINYNKLLLDTFKNSFILKNPMIMYDNKKQNLDLINERLNNLINNKLDKSRNNLERIIEKLELLNPLSVLKRGYSIIYKDDQVITKTSLIKQNDLLKIKLFKGDIDVVVKEVNNG
ncbi:MAG: exodeoxyribonuclease VII large subunit [Bacilli bacterium]|nr:exodeoxyribonuclease VII large subunit [Bacilli bacterium]MDD4809381.1 exodeoxyribonuclease VII large subunit [Bacilli bacterium]